MIVLLFINKLSEYFVPPHFRLSWGQNEKIIENFDLYTTNTKHNCIDTLNELQGCLKKTF